MQFNTKFNVGDIVYCFSKNLEQYIKDNLLTPTNMFFMYIVQTKVNNIHIDQDKTKNITITYELISNIPSFKNFKSTNNEIDIFKTKDEAKQFITIKHHQLLNQMKVKIDGYINGESN